MDTLYIVMPAYNEQENIRRVVEQWYPLLSDKSEHSRLVIADRGSNDQTHAILLELQKKYSQLEILENNNQYHGPKVIALYDYAIRQGADYVFQTDSDGQTNPDEFKAFWNARHQYDGIFGNRTIREDGKDRAFVEKVVCLLLKIYFKVSVPDANAPFRLMNCKALKKYLYKMPSDYNIPNIMITTYFVHYNEKVRFNEISFKPRSAGTNSINIRKIIRIGWNALKDFHRFKKEL
ncbi:MAG: glycosyltransferase family 2 protein [Eubacteriales bacterium]|nr:glycosyltransferase family 2 protein [Eubacteriales bacterium]